MECCEAVLFDLITRDIKEINHVTQHENYSVDIKAINQDINNFAFTKNKNLRD